MNDEVIAQDEPIMLSNPSFEGYQRAGEIGGRMPSGWYDCGFVGETVPDVHPIAGGAFEVTKAPKDGESYLGMVVRENDTWEAISQRLERPLEKDKCYEFSLSLARSLLYKSSNRLYPDSVINYVTPVKLRIWGGHGYCNKEELLAESSLIINSRWLVFNFKFEPKSTYSHLMFEAFYKTPTLFPYNGNVLLDNASPIFVVPCDVSEVPVAVDEPIKETPPTPAPAEPENPPTPPVVDNTTNNPPPAKPKIMSDLDRNKLEVGQTLRIEKLYFEADRSNFTEDSYDVLNEIYVFLSDNRDVIVEIGGHTNTIPDQIYCDELSTARAKAVVDFLINKGIKDGRLTFKGYGKRHPIDRNDHFNRLARKKNQRVEIKVLSIGE